jgi:hypothetical protein
MLTREDLVANFSGVTDLTTDIVRGKDVLPKVTFFNYVRPARVEGGQDLLLVSEGNPDDEFAQAVLSRVPETPPDEALDLQEIAQNKYGFEALLLAPSTYHAYFKGRLDDKRALLTLCIPIYRCEFSGTESVEEFTTLRRDVVPILSWTRAPAPKTVLRFDNPKTRAGTGARYVLVKVPLVVREVDNIEGVANAFIELLNYKGEVLEILSPRPEVFTCIRERNDASRIDMGKPELLKRVHDFLTA